MFQLMKSKRILPAVLLRLWVEQFRHHFDLQVSFHVIVVEVFQWQI